MFQKINFLLTSTTITFSLFAKGNYCKVAKNCILFSFLIQNLSDRQVSYILILISCFWENVRTAREENK